MRAPEQFPGRQLNNHGFCSLVQALASVDHFQPHRQVSIKGWPDILHPPLIAEKGLAWSKCEQNGEADSVH